MRPNQRMRGEECKVPALVPLKPAHGGIMLQNPKPTVFPSEGLAMTVPHEGFYRAVLRRC